MDSNFKQPTEDFNYYCKATFDQIEENIFLIKWPTNFNEGLCVVEINNLTDISLLCVVLSVAKSFI